jgi:hypothetical protein
VFGQTVVFLKSTWISKYKLMKSWGFISGNLASNLVSLLSWAYRGGVDLLNQIRVPLDEQEVNAFVFDWLACRS